MDANEYQRAAMQFLNPATAADDQAQRDNAVLGLVGEAGEIADKLKKHLFHGAPDKHPFDRELVLDEGGDVLWYVALLCEWAGVTLEEVMQFNIDKLSKRYPGCSFDPKRSWERYEQPSTAEMEVVAVYFDGASRGNPGPASAGWVIKGLDGKVLDTGYCKLAKPSTNNQAEYTAAIEGVRHALAVAGRHVGIDLRGDSQLVIKQLTGEYRINSLVLAVLNESLREELNKAKAWSTFWIPREQNQEADALANEALDAKA